MTKYLCFLYGDLKSKPYLTIASTKKRAHSNFRVRIGGYFISKDEFNKKYSPWIWDINDWEQYQELIELGLV